MTERKGALAPRPILEGQVVKIIWRDAVEGPSLQDLARQSESYLRDLTTAIVSTVGRYLIVANGYLILDEVLQEESTGRLIYEKQSIGKWLAIPLGAIMQISQAGQPLSFFANQTRRRRTILKQLRFLSRTKRLTTGELSRTLYIV